MGCLARPGVDAGPPDAGTDADAGGDWFDIDWSRRKPLVIGAANVVEDLDDFPVLVFFTDADIGAAARPDGRDLRFVDDSGVVLAHEFEKLEASTLIAWVKVPLLSSTSDTTIYVYYDNPSAAAPPSPAAVWSNGFTGVYHFGDGGVLDTGDSLGTNDGTNGGAAAGFGLIHGAASFGGGVNIRAEAAGIDSRAGARNTVTLWMQYTGPNGDAVFAFDTGSQGYPRWMVRDGCFGFNTEQGEVLGTTMTGLRDRWVHVAAVFYNGVPSPAENEIYIDGQPQTLTECQVGSGAAARTAGSPIWWASTDGYEFEGLLDEGRLANVARSAGWIGTEFANQSEPSSFVTAGAEEPRP